MICFSLHCDQEHKFDIWFRSNDDYEMQSKQGLVHCPECGSVTVKKMLVAPAVITARQQEHNRITSEKTKANILKKLHSLSRAVRENAEYVGEQFAEEARKIHFGEVDPHAIYGKADTKEVISLLQEGIDILPLPPLPEEQN